MRTQLVLHLSSVNAKQNYTKPFTISIATNVMALIRPEPLLANESIPIPKKREKNLKDSTYRFQIPLPEHMNSFTQYLSPNSPLLSERIAALFVSRAKQT